MTHKEHRPKKEDPLSSRLLANRPVKRVSESIQHVVYLSSKGTSTPPMAVSMLPCEGKKIKGGLTLEGGLQEAYTIRSSVSLPVFFYFGFFPATSCTGAWAVCELGSTTHPPGRLTRRSRRRGSRRQTLSATIGRRQLLHTWQKAKSSLESCLNSGRTCPFLIGVYCYSGTCPRHVDRFMLLEFSS